VGCLVFFVASTECVDVVVLQGDPDVARIGHYQVWFGARDEHEEADVVFASVDERRLFKILLNDEVL